MMIKCIARKRDFVHLDFLNFRGDDLLGNDDLFFNTKCYFYETLLKIQNLPKKQFRKHSELFILPSKIKLNLTLFFRKRFLQLYLKKLRFLVGNVLSFCPNQNK